MSSSKPILHILVPHLLQPLKLWQQDFAFKAESPVLDRLLQQHQKKIAAFKGLEYGLFSLLGYPLDTELPIAHLRAQLENNPTLGNHQGTMLCADPVHLKAGTQEIIMDTNPINDLSEDDADALINLLNSHFNQDGVQFVKGQYDRWYLLLAGDEVVRTTPLSEAKGQDIAKLLPHSEARNLHSLQNEMQMLLFNADVNKQREARGLPSVNSLWLWGGGERKKARTSLRSVHGGGILGKISAQYAQCAYFASSLNPMNDLQHLPTGAGHHVLILDQLSKPALNEDIQSWQQALTLLEKKWFSPALTQFEKNKLDILIHSCDGQYFIPEKKKLINRLSGLFKSKDNVLMDLI